MSTYYSRAGSYSRSYNAEVAESEGRAPMSRAMRVVAARYGCSQSTAKCALELLHDGEWHHVGKYANRVDYYDTTDDRLGGVISHIESVGGAKKWRDRRAVLQSQRESSVFYRDAPGRFTVLFNLRRKYSAEAALALGHAPIASVRDHGWDSLRAIVMPIDACLSGVIRAALSLGWTLDQSVMAAATAGYPGAWIRAFMQEEGVIA